jgi:predicted flap endonuclease-1-like 5' DNA nuclease
MASPPEAYSYDSSVVEAKPRLREEVREELREELRTLDMNRIAPEEKLRIERQAVEGSVGDVELFERSWRKTQPETLSEIERKIDELGAEPPLPPQIETPRGRGPLPASLPPRSPSVTTLSPAPVPPGPRRVRALSGRLSPSEEKAIAKHLAAEVKRTNVLFNTTRGRVVEVEFKRGQEVGSTTLTVNVDGEVSTLDEIGSKLDSMSFPQAGLPSDVLAPSRPGEPELSPVGERESAEAPRPTAGGKPAQGTKGGVEDRRMLGLSPSTRNQPVDAIEGVGETFGGKLRAANIRIVEDLLRDEPENIAGRADIPAELVRKWQAMARLQAIKGVGPQYSELLVRAGVSDLESMAKQTPSQLSGQLNAYQATLDVKVQGNAITPNLVDDWVRQARQLTGVKPGKKAPESPKKKFGLGFGKKGATSTQAPAPTVPATPSSDTAPPEPTGEKGKRKFGLPFGKK